MEQAVKRLIGRRSLFNCGQVNKEQQYVVCIITCHLVSDAPHYP